MKITNNGYNMLEVNIQDVSISTTAAVVGTGEDFDLLKNVALKNGSILLRANFGGGLASFTAFINKTGNSSFEVDGYFAGVLSRVKLQLVNGELKASVLS